MLPTHAVFDSIPKTTLPEERMQSENRNTERDRYLNIGSVGGQERSRHKERMKESKYGEYVPKNTTLTYKIDGTAFSTLADVNMSKVIKFSPDKMPKYKFSILATNCPLPKLGRGITSQTSIDRFWNVAFSSERVDGIVVLGNADGRDIIDYWNPLFVDCTAFYNDDSRYRIISSVEEETSFYIKYEIIIHNRESGAKKTINLWHYTDWPDGKSPTNPDNFERFVKMFVGNRKLIVHCSAGVGRTGVFAACLQALKSGGFKNPKEVVEYMRAARAGMVQKPEQFDIICKFILRNCYDQKEVGWRDDLTSEQLKIMGITERDTGM